MDNYIITLRNKELYDFYAVHKIDPEVINVHFMNLLKPILEISPSGRSYEQELFMDKLSTLTTNFDSFCNNFHTQLHASNEKHMDLLKLIVQSNTTEHIQPLLRDVTEQLISKTNEIIHTAMPTEHVSTEITNQFSQLRTTIKEETLRFTSSSMDKSSIDTFLATIHNALSNITTNISTNMVAFETRIENKLTETDRMVQSMFSSVNENNTTQRNLSTRVSDVLKKFEKSADKGALSENITYNILLDLYPMAQIDQVGKEKETGDIMITRQDRPTILVENKDHETKNVTKQEVDKFIRDCDTQNCCGVMFAQHRGITNKQNFELQIHNDNVLLYVYNVQFNPIIIKFAIDAVEQYKISYDKHIATSENRIIIDIDTLTEINNEFKNYATQKANICKLLKDFNDRMTFSLNELKLPSIEHFLSTRFATSSVSPSTLTTKDTPAPIICSYCNGLVAKQLNSHYRFCKVYQAQKKNSGHNSDDDSSVSDSSIGGGGGGGGVSRSKKVSKKK